MKAKIEPKTPPAPPATTPAPADTPVPPPPVDPFDALTEDYLGAETIHAAYESGLVCSKCDQPVQKDWPRCPVCGNTKATSLSNTKPRLKFTEAITKYRPAPLDNDEVVTVKETPKAKGK